jgi:hypothetical protein
MKLPAAENVIRYRVVLTTDEDGVYTAECPSLPGCISQGATRELALKNIHEAMTEEAGGDLTDLLAGRPSSGRSYRIMTYKGYAGQFRKH